MKGTGVVKSFQVLAAVTMASVFTFATMEAAQAQNVPPTVSLTSPAPNTVFVAPAAITLTAAASDTDGIITGVQFFHGTTSIGSDTTAPYSVTWSSVPAGSYSITATATDDTGATTTSAATTITVGANAAPTVSLMSPTTNQSFTSPSTILLSANASDTDGTVSKVDFFSGTTPLATVTDAPYSHVWSNVQPGSYSITAKATDNIGAHATSAPSSITVVANTAPTVSIAVNPTGGNAPATITLSANANDADGSINNVEFYAGNQLIGAATQAPFTYTWSSVAAGTYSVTSRATDNAGMSSTSSAVTVTIGAGSTQTQAQVYFIEADHLNTPRVVTNSSGQVEWSWDNTDPFGANLPNQASGSTANAFVFNLRFPGQYYDYETGLHYNYFRDYDPSTGRYVQSDPIGLEGGINTYGYVGGNPLSYKDPNGLFAWLPGAVGGVIGGVAGGIGYLSSGAPSNLSLLGAVGLGAVVGAGAAYIPSTWGTYGALAGGALGGAAGDLGGQFIGQRAKAKAEGQCFKFQPDWVEVGVQGGLGGLSGVAGLSAGLGARGINSIAPKALNEDAVSAGASGISQMGVNLLVPTSYGGYRP